MTKRKPKQALSPAEAGPLFWPSKAVAELATELAETRVQLMGAEQTLEDSAEEKHKQQKSNRQRKAKMEADEKKLRSIIDRLQKSGDPKRGMIAKAIRAIDPNMAQSRERELRRRLRS